MPCRTGRAAPPWPDRAPSAADRASYADARPVPFWLDASTPPSPRPALLDDERADLAIVGGGLSGLWAALEAARSDPARSVVLLEGGRLAGGASGRSGGFLSSSLTHGIANGLARYPAEMPALERLGRENFDAICATVAELGIDCGLERNGDIGVALQPHECDALAAEAAECERLGHSVELLDGERVRAEVRSPLFLAGLWQRSGSALLDPARLAWGLADAAETAGVRIHERTRVERVRRGGGGVELIAASGRVHARRALLATAAARGLVAPIRRRVVAVYDYVLVSEPLSRTQRESLAWSQRQGLSDSANRFHYYRLVADGEGAERLLWGGYDAIYRLGTPVGPALEQREASFAGLAQRLFACFPQLEGLRFSHRWGGAIDTCSRFFAFAGAALGGRVAYTVGHTGLGIGASRFGARAALGLLDGRRPAPRMAYEQPLPFPPEPLRWAAIELTRNRLAAADRSGGQRGIWLRALDRAGLGFDS